MQELFSSHKNYDEVNRITEYVLINIQIYDANANKTEGHIYIDKDGCYHTISIKVAHELIHQGINSRDMVGRAALMPGFCETHIHGYAGHDFSSQDEETQDLKKMRQAMKDLGKTGVTALMPTTVSLNIPNLKSRLRMINAFVAQEEHEKTPGLPTIVGVHLEGPFISCLCKGAHDEKVIQEIEKSGINIELFEDIIAAAPHIKHWKLTIDPALPGMITFLDKIKDGLRNREGSHIHVYPFIGHTNPSEAILKKAMDTGAICGFTHLANAMGETAHRNHSQNQSHSLSMQNRIQSNVVKLAFDTGGNYNNKAIFSELIVDGVHVSKAFVEYAAKTLGTDRIVLVTDALGSSGLPDGAYRLGNVPVVKEREQFWIAEKDNPDKATTKLAGSAATFGKVTQQYLQWIGGGFEAILFASVINPRQSTYPNTAIHYNDTQNFVIINEEGALLLNGCNGIVYSHPQNLDDE